jgi:hypothetical protein
MLPPAHSLSASKRVLEPHERVAEVLFGLIMVLTFTGSLSIADAGRDDIRTMLIGALGCNLAWGIIDGVLYLMGCLAEKGRLLVNLRALRQMQPAPEARRLITDALPAPLAAVLEPGELDSLAQRLRELPSPPERARLDRRDWQGAVGVFFLVFLSTFPVAFPFIIMHEKELALRISNLIAVLMLFGTGYAFGRITGNRPWRVGIAMVLLGAVLVALTIALGG